VKIRIPVRPVLTETITLNGQSLIINWFCEPPQNNKWYRVTCEEWPAYNVRNIYEWARNGQVYPCDGFSLYVEPWAEPSWD
jgi:hypothetical protein